MQNRLLFHQSSVSLEIIGLPDYSNNENKDQISIISQWKLVIIDKPLIEGKIEHLFQIMEAFYVYSNLLISNDIPKYESKLIDIKAENLDSHNIVLKSSKPDVKPLTINIPKKVRFGINTKDKFFNFLLPPVISICSLILFSSAFIHFYDYSENKEKIELINSK